jgi:hypothetical protein
MSRLPGSSVEPLRAEPEELAPLAAELQLFEDSP